ncbi:hypothetical protein HZY91_02500 [Facklamia sp. DSM 111018]|uniref:Uncharacterized protein n=1 Tax=Facklamia lactis TaxID=2749967 RepID=A0ABS0LNL4_9LACT|nr:hypothetical protein [Facklamia lactis]MBG9985760.1 hypothetical protein [Facklamia lactis]
MEKAILSESSSLVSFEQTIEDLKASLLEEGDVEIFEEKEAELGFMFSKGGGSRLRQRMS